MLPDEEVSGEAATVETTETAPEAVVLSSEPANGEPERDYEAEAREQGWYPEAEFKGTKKPAKFLSAQEFVERGEELSPIVKRATARLEKEYEARFAKLEKMTDKTVAKLRADHAAEIEALNTRKDAAIKEGDVAAVRKIDKQIADHEANAPEPEELKKTEDQEAVLVAWQKENPWYETDEDLTIAANTISQKLARADPNLSMADNLAQTMAKMREKYPLKLGGKTAGNGHSAVDGGALNGGQPPNKDPLAKLPAIEREQAKKDMAKYPKQYPTADAWLKAYNS